MTRLGPGAAGPRANRDPAELDRKTSLLHEPHVAPLTAHVERLRAARGADRVPFFDPTEAGVHAPILLLLEAPGAKATRERGGSGFISPDNNDGSAQNMWELLAEAGIDRSADVVTWNVVPWYIGSDSKIRPAESEDLTEARPYLQEFLGLLEQLQVVVLIGKHAARGWERLGLDLPTVECPHPSPQNLNSRPHLRPQILAALQQAKAIADSAEAIELAPTAGAAVLNENQVVDAVAEHLRRQGWSVHAARHGHQRGVDVEASRDGETLHVEAKGATSSREGSKKHGRSFGGGEVRINVAEAFYTAAIAATAGVATRSAIAVPDDELHARYMAPLRPALEQLGIAILLVAGDGTVTAAGI